MRVKSDALIRSGIILPFLFLSAIPRCEAQEDSLFYRYNDIILGLNVGFTNESNDYNYFFYDTTSTTLVANDYDLYMNTKIFSMLSFKSKYFSFNFNISPLSNWLNQLVSYSVRNSTPSKSTYAFSLYPKQFMLSAKYVRVKGALDVGNRFDFDGTIHDTLIADYRRNQFELNGVYFTNRKFSFSRAHSLLYFPKKSMFTFLGAVNLFYQSNTNGGSGFIPSDNDVLIRGNTYIVDHTCEHASEITYYGAQLLPGIEFFLTFKLEPNAKAQMRMRAKHPEKTIKPLWPYLHASIKGGPSFYNGTIKAIDKRYDTESWKIGSSIQFAMKYGINMRHYNMEVLVTYYKNKYSLNNFSESQHGIMYGVLYAFRIPFNKGYAKIDSKLKK